MMRLNLFFCPDLSECKTGSVKYLIEVLEQNRSTDCLQSINREPSADFFDNDNDGRWTDSYGNESLEDDVDAAWDEIT